MTDTGIQDLAQRLAAKACAALQDIRDGRTFPEDVYREIENDSLLIRQMFHGPVEERFQQEEADTKQAHAIQQEMGNA